MIPSGRLLHSKIIRGRFSFKDLCEVVDAFDFIHFRKVRA